ncbi:MAG: TAXI family TRAP transporter solute-binding subunit [Alphaproteobacteria bacterium]|nr:TAXI family TRAP transporter solute-binding subunit [Alphaproteobacteria bacterium]
MRLAKIATAIAPLALGGMIAAAALPAQAQQTRLVMAGSSSGGTAYLYFAALSQLLNKYVPGMEATARSGGAVENVALLERGSVDVAVAGPGDASQVLGAEGLAKTKIRTLFAMFNIPFHIVVPKDSPAKSLADLKGKRLAIGIKAGGEANLFLRMIAEWGYKESDFRIDYIGKGEMTNAYKDGVLDGMTFLCPLPCPVITDVATHPRGARLLPIPEADVAKVRAKYQWYTPYVVEKAVYANALKDQAVDTPTLTEWIYVATRADYPEETVYQIAKVIGDKHAELVAAFKAGQSSTAENTARFPGFPLHPGTQRYLKEKGLLK